MIYLDLLIGFLKVGLFAFGGAYAAIPIIRDVVISYGWISDEMLSYMIAVSESTPGPIMLNLATYVGVNQGGILGAIIANLAVVLPSFVIIILVSKILEKFIKNKYFKAVLRGLKPSIIGIILAIGVTFIFKNILSNNLQIDYISLILTAILAIIFFGSRKVLKKGISPILLILISGIAGIVTFGLI